MSSSQHSGFPPFELFEKNTSFQLFKHISHKFKCVFLKSFLFFSVFIGKCQKKNIFQTRFIQVSVITTFQVTSYSVARHFAFLIFSLNFFSCISFRESKVYVKVLCTLCKVLRLIFNGLREPYVKQGKYKFQLNYINVCQSRSLNI